LDGKNDGYSIDDAANTLVCHPSLKRATKLSARIKRLPAFYRKSKEKKLENVVEQKKKKENVSTTIIDNKAQPV
jgi:hypothetical protein